MSKIVAGEDYRVLHGWKYTTKKPMSCEVQIPATAETEYIILHTRPDYTTNKLVLRKDYAWDGASFVARDTANIMRASLFHDSLCQLIREGLLDKKYRKYADQLLRQHCLEDGMSKFRAWYVYMAVRAYSRAKGM